jgi:hypothetical protein
LTAAVNTNNNNNMMNAVNATNTANIIPTANLLRGEDAKMA